MIIAEPLCVLNTRDMHMILKVTVLWQQQALMFTLVHITKIAIFVLSVNYDVQMKKSERK